MSTNSLYPGTTNGVCVTSIIKDKIREYMMGDSSQQIKSPVEISICEVDKENAADSVIQENKNVNKQDPVSTTDLILPSTLDVSIHNSTEPCPHKQDIVNSVRRIGNSLDALLQESKKASHTKPVKKSCLANHQNTDRLFISSDQLRSRKSVSLHDICEEYIQFITVNSSVSADEETITTTSDSGTERNSIKEEEPELEIIPVSAALPIRHSQISVITINESSPRKHSNTVIKQSVEEMLVAVKNEIEKSNGENDGNENKLSSEKEIVDTPDEKLFTNINGVKSPLEEKENDSPVAKNDATEDVADKDAENDEKLTLSNGVSHNVNDDIEEEDIEEEDEHQEETVESSKPEPKSSEPSPKMDEKTNEKPATAEASPMETDQTDESTTTVENEKVTVDEPKGSENESKKEPEKEEETIEKSDVPEEVVSKVVETVEEKPAEKKLEPVPAEEETKMDTSELDPELEPVTKPEEVKPSETKCEITVESKPTEIPDKDKEAESKKIKSPERNTPSEPKVDKKSAEIDKEATPVVKEGTTSTSSIAGVKRKADAGDEVEQDRDGGISSSSSTSGSEADNTQDCKRIRFDESIFEEDERERLIREFVERSTESSEEIGKNCDKLQHEIAALSDLARAKELEWNSIMRLLKLKEEMLERILFKKRHLDCQNKPELDANLNKMYKNFVTSSTVSIDQIKPNRNEPSPPTSINNHVTMVPVSSSGSSATASNGALNPTSQDLFGGKSANSSATVTESAGSKSRQHRPILPKPPVTSAQAVPSSHAGLVPPHPQQQPQQPTLLPHSSQPPQPSNMMQQGASLLIDQNSVIGEGRQGPIVDVKSIIADFRSKNPDSLPRRGRRSLVPFAGRIPDGGPGPRFLGNTSLLSMANMAMGSGSHVRTSVSSTTHNDHRPGGFLIGQDNSIQTSLGRTEMQMRHPHIDSLMSTLNAAAAAGNSSQPNSSSNSNNSNNNSFQEALVKFAKMNEKRDMSSNAGLHLGSGKGGSHLPPPPPYPEVTLHPVLVPQSSGSPPVQNSLLHGILTKSNAAAAAAANQHHPSSTVGNAAAMNATSVGNIQHRPTTFSPTLARLLTAPERNRVSRSAVGSSSRNTKSTLNEILNSKKTRTEVTITPVTTSAACTTKNGSDVVLDDDDESEAADRLVIDEGREVAAESASNVIPADQVPECQGCHKKAAQFVCAGCGNQWYCSRECQVQAWEDHSEMCSG